MLAKLIGRDAELSTTGIDGSGRSISPGNVTAAVLDHIRPVFAERGVNVWSRRDQFHSTSMDCLRNWVANGQCYYSDMAHVECCTAGCFDPHDFAAQSWHLILAAEAARRRAEAEAGDGTEYSLTTANVDALDPSVSFGTHLSVAVEPDLFEDLFLVPRHPSRLAMLSSGLAAAIAFFGDGYLLPLKEGSQYSLSGRAHHITKLVSPTTTEPFGRGMVNSRREPHGDGHERVHIIGFDYGLISAALVCSFLQTLFAALEEGLSRWQLYDPLRAFRQWAWGLNLRTGEMPVTAHLVDGRRMTLPLFLRELTGTLLKMCEAGVIPEHVAPRAPELLPVIIDLTHYAEQGAVDRCARHLGWASKLLWLTNMEQQTGLAFESPDMRLADHDFSNTDPHRGCIWTLWEQNLIDPLVKREQIERCWNHGPVDTRDYGRGQLIQRFGDWITDVNWSSIALRRSSGMWSRRVRIEFPHGDSFSREQFDPLLGDADTVEDLVARLDGHVSDTDPIVDVAGDLQRPE